MVLTKIAISVESTHDLTKDLLNKYDIKVIPYQINLGDLSFKDGQYAAEEIFDLVNKYNTLPKTTALNQFEYIDFFKSLLNEYDGVIHIALSSGITSSCGNAINAAKTLDNVFVVDSLSLTTGIGALAVYAREIAESGYSIEKIAEMIKNRAKSLQVSFVLERLDYLYKGGRCSGLQFFGANLLKLRPRIVLKDGKMKSSGKYRGKMQNVVEQYCEETLSEFNTPDLNRVFITYTTATSDMVSAARTFCEKIGFKEIMETKAGGTIASHCGANTLGIIYFNDGKANVLNN